MPLAPPHRQKQVRLTVVDNEPLARLAEQRLRQAGIPCFARSLQGGPGAWGSAANLPHALYVYEADEMLARDTLGLPPLELAERDRKRTLGSSGSGLRWAMGAMIVAALALGILMLLLSRGAG